MKIAYECIIKQQSDGKYLVHFPEFEEAITEGETLEEALFNAGEVLTLTLDARMDEEMSIPLPLGSSKSVESAYLVYPSPRVQSALLVRFCP